MATPEELAEAVTLPASCTDDIIPMTDRVSKPSKSSRMCSSQVVSVPNMDTFQGSVWGRCCESVFRSLALGDHKKFRTCAVPRPRCCCTRQFRTAASIENKSANCPGISMIPGPQSSLKNSVLKGF